MRRTFKRQWRRFALRTRRQGRVLISAAIFPVVLAIVLSAYTSPTELKSITIISNGEILALETTENFVGDALTAAGVQWSTSDILLPPALASIEDGEVITLHRSEKTTLTRVVPIPFETTVLKNSRLRLGSEVELRSGVRGARNETVRVEMIDGVPHEEIVSAEVILEPVSRKVYRGTRDTGRTVSSVEMEATAYTAGAESCWPYVDGKTATMQAAGYGVAAVDPTVVPLGTRLYVEGYGFAVASDIGGDIKGNRIDLFMPELRTARKFGRRDVTVHLLD